MSFSCIYFSSMKIHFGEQIYHCFFWMKRKHKSCRINLSYILDNTTSYIHWYYNFQMCLNKTESGYHYRKLHPQQKKKIIQGYMTGTKLELISSPCIDKNHKFSWSCVNRCLRLQVIHNSFCLDKRTGSPAHHGNFYRESVGLRNYGERWLCLSYSDGEKIPGMAPDGSSGTIGQLPSPVERIYQK